MDKNSLHLHRHCPPTRDWEKKLLNTQFNLKLTQLDDLSILLGN